IWAPFDLWVGPDPTAPGAVDNEVISGTSVSAPFVSGVAALIEAVNPSMSADEIEHTLISTAHVGSSSQVHRWIDAYSAVKQAAGGKAPPFIRITRPIADSSDLHRPFDEPFQAEVTDADSDLTVTWADSVDGPLGTGISITHPSLSYGTHVITATATSRGVSHSTSITVTRTNVTPTMTILAPQAGTPLYTGQIISLLASSSDPNELGGTLSDSQVSWLREPNCSERAMLVTFLATRWHLVRMSFASSAPTVSIAPKPPKTSKSAPIPPIFPPSLARSARPTTRTSVMRTLI
ncbi:MAG TPA: S8 family serine peptidase, partial [Polyangiaceae bacterium]|nr:S8 family serine peptidase [Polyangiaceae bacterium]